MIPEPLFYAALAYGAAFAIGYVWLGLALGAVYRKFGARPARAWVPVLRYSEMATLTQSGSTAVIVVRLVALLGAVASLIGILVGSSTGDALALGGLAVAAVASFVAWVLWVLHAHRLGLDHSLSTGFTVLAAVLPWVWAAVVGWSSAGASTATGPIPIVTAARAGAPEAAPMAPPVPGPEPEAVSAPAVEVVTPATEAVPAPARILFAEADLADADQLADTDGGSHMDDVNHRGAPVPEPVAGDQPTTEPTPVPVVVPTDTVPIAVRRSPYADLAPRHLDPPAIPERRSPYASLAPRDLGGSDDVDAPAALERDVPEPAPTTPTFLVVPTLPAPVTDDLPTVAPATDPTPVAESASAPAPVTEPLARVVPTAPVPFMDPTPSGPVSPYMRGGAAAPPAPPAAVPSFEMPATLPAPAPVPAPAPAPAAEPEPAPTPAPTAEPARASSPWAPVTPVGLPVVPAPSASTTPTPAEPAVAPIDPAPAPPVRGTVPEASPTLAPAPVEGAAPQWAGGAAFPGTAAAATPLVAPPSAVAPGPEPRFDAAEDDRTQVSARVRERWELVASDGRAYPLDAGALLVGRAGGFPPLDGTPRLEIDDATRTVSKSHARLALDNGRWTVEDLGSTNGTFLIDPLGRETQVAPGAAVAVEGRLAFGDVELELRRRDGA